jgi:hypothetical protein
VLAFYYNIICVWIIGYIVLQFFVPFLDALCRVKRNWNQNIIYMSTAIFLSEKIE